jgi:hypothetical protein
LELGFESLDGRRELRNIRSRLGLVGRTESSWHGHDDQADQHDDDGDDDQQLDKGKGQPT